MNLTFEFHLYSVKMNQLAKYLGERSFRSKVVVRHTDTHGTYCSTWTTKVFCYNGAPLVPNVNKTFMAISKFTSL